MASLGFIGLGISSVSGRGISKSSGASLVGKRAKAPKEPKTNPNAKVPFEVIVELRKMREAGLKPTEIFNKLGMQYMSFDYMRRVLQGDVRVWS